ncbi:MAG TPA: HNH endonuclease domain-containing protein, partial [Vicinamibacteria bacterium]
RCFYCDGRIRGKGAVDHFIPWSRYPLDFGHNYVLADAGCNGNKGDRLAFHGHLRRWCERNVWAYSQTERTNANVWQEGRDGLVALDSAWRHLPGLLNSEVRSYDSRADSASARLVDRQGVASGNGQPHQRGAGDASGRRLPRDRVAAG